MQDLTSAAAYYHHQSMLMMAAKQQQQQQQQPESPEQHQLKCPRCDSPNTKFCYYNNYNLSQPRHYCKNCRRYWTKGGSLRNIPVGGGSRKNTKRSSSSSPSSSNLKDKTVAVPDQKPNSEEESRPKLVEEERRMTGQEMDPTRMLYGLPVGDPRFTSLLGADVGISYETGSNWYPGIHLGLGPGIPRDD